MSSSAATDTEATILSLHIGLPRELGTPGATDPMERPWSSGIYKSAVEGPHRITGVNLEGDGQADRKRHGGPDKVICVYPAAHYPYWRRDLSIPDLEYGAFGENFTVDGQVEEDVAIGDIVAVGTAVLQITQPRQPCWKLARRWRIKDLAARVQRTGYTGWYYRLLEEGEVARGQRIELVERPYPEWTIARANHVMHNARHDRESAAALAACAPLSASWKRTLSTRAATGENPDPKRRLVGPNEG